MPHFKHWFGQVMQVLESDDEACLELISAAAGASPATISTLLDDLTPSEALAYARTLLELGRVHEAAELVGLVVHSALQGSATPRAQGAQAGGAPQPQGAQRRFTR